MNISDQIQRQEALDPEQSFIVQAPAGSGKTELLTQRYLRLLARANVPEDIIAITFTRKAAAEMRTRILEALQFAVDHPTPPQETHVAQRWQLANAVLEHNQTKNWNLLENPNRLRIQTIDSLCASLTRQMPVLSHFGATPDITDQPNAFYQMAAREVLAALETKHSWKSSLITLLLHLDNDHQKAEKLFCVMLAKRDQWLPYILEKKNQREVLETALQTIITETFSNLNLTLPSHLKNELFECLEFSLSNTGKVYSEKWLAIADLLLTKENQWRKNVDARNGFPAHEKIMKQRIKTLLEEISHDENFYQALVDLRAMPPANYRDSQWQILIALFELLPILVAHLQLIFQEHRIVDYIEVSYSALKALGTAENPTDLALTLDYQIKHLLIDEFQDTSITQLRLLEQLTAGWQPDDGRTLFLVGDPMQSIYRFRKAEVSLFLKIKKSGINAIPLKFLALNTNFRSTKTIVTWINQTFQSLMPQQENIGQGAIKFSHSNANYDLENSKIQQHWLVDTDSTQEAQTIVSIVQKNLTDYPNNKIAILVRARSHLIEITAALQKTNFAYRAVEIETLSEHAIIQDLLALTRALLHPADRIAWLSILRAPWCGLTLSDLHLLATSSTLTIWEQLLNLENLNLSDDGKQRLQFIVPILKNSLDNRYRQPLRHWIESTWLDLNGPICLPNQNELNNAKTFFNLLDQLKTADSIVDMTYFTEKLSSLYATPNNQTDIKIEIMTIHKAKGLEFDTVILPGLNRTLTHDDHDLLLCSERVTHQGKTDLLFAPIKASSDEEDAIYDYLCYEEKKKSEHETARLLYVAATRAKHNLHLVGLLKRDKKTEIKMPAQNSFLAQLWPTLSNINENTKNIEIPNSNNTLLTQKPFKRLISHSLTNPKTFTTFHTQQVASLDNWSINPARHIGTVIHYFLCKISHNNLDQWDETAIIKLKPTIQNLLLQLGVIPHELEKCATTVMQALLKTLHCSRGRWILQQNHDAHSEYALTAKINHEIKSVVIDRTFIDENNIRWIIDYKTTTQIEVEYHREQLENYAQIMHSLDTREIHLGLYFPLLSEWHEWKFSRR